MPQPQPTEAQRIAHALGDDAIAPLEWPHRDERSVNEYSHVALFAQPFPTLFPKATADIIHVDPERPRTKEVDYGDWLAHPMAFEYGYFARHPGFRYYA